jgi:hypothetical protein
VKGVHEPVKPAYARPLDGGVRHHFCMELALPGGVAALFGVVLCRSCCGDFTARAGTSSPFLNSHPALQSGQVYVGMVVGGGPPGGRSSTIGLFAGGADADCASQ